MAGCVWRWGAFHLGEEGLGEVVGITSKEGNWERIRKQLWTEGMGTGYGKLFWAYVRGQGIT